MSAEVPLAGGLFFLVGHTEHVGDDMPLERVVERFTACQRDFMAVVKGEALVGVCSRRDVAHKMGARFGFALFGHTPVREHLMGDVLTLGVDSDLTAALTAVSERSIGRFYDDVLVVAPTGAFVGFILVHELVRLQTRLLLGNIADLERSRREIEQKNAMMKDDLLMAREVQRAMLPDLARESVPGDRWRVATHYAPAEGVSGDFYQVIRVSPGHCGILVCDVMGHGVRSALIAAMLGAFAADLRSCAQEPARVLTLMNQCLFSVLRRAGTMLFVTAAYVAIDVPAGRFSYSQAGHPPGLIRRRSGAVSSLPGEGVAAGPALGLIEDNVYEQEKGNIDAGDAILLFTDGLTEARNERDEEWGIERLREGVSHSAGKSLEGLLGHLVAQSQAFCGRPFDDDVCLVAVEACDI
jgi:phosphoserine phosphatase RsbU/P